jgi:hypothetical protein
LAVSRWETACFWNPFRKALRIDSIESLETLLEKVQKGY